MGWEDVVRNDLREIGTSWEGERREVMNKLEWRSSVCRSLGFR
jgi:hypothetical protein